ncbi:xanthine dehydrogenase [Anoxybacter fermentans]|uniref:Xanthine dehydrogenase n=1 Tax=Anoxybacter fermentans TaxID=1323375 RepID=A0A3S9SWM3_9FIRM|nr:xanthine dehydrogenase family protein molybdopterin-binding subunit [Anoxybacter fermentans]AZR72668.1 xanthine dehydrogenase [Anoxybacter fermentans]
MKVVGKRVKRIDAVSKVTGEAKYVDDMKFEGMLYAKIKRSPYPHAKILNIDTSKAEALPGVEAVITGKDFPNTTGLYMADRTVFAIDKVRYIGDAVAAVAAESEEIAEKALELIEVEYEELPALFDPIEAMKEDAPLIHENLHEYDHAVFIHPVPHTNISEHFKLRKGDVEKGFKEADYIIEDEFSVPMVHHVPLETHTAIAKMSLDGQLEVISSCQSPFAVRQLLGHVFDIPLNKITVKAEYIGGGFGGKAGLQIEPMVVALAMTVPGRYIRLTYTREEEFQAAVNRQGLRAKYKSGVRKDGKIVAQEITYIWDAGAYNDYGVNIVKTAGYSCSGPYEIENVKADSYCVYTNHPVGCAYRGFGMCEIHWGIEQHMDNIAEKLGLSPVEIRKINGLKDGSLTVTNERLQDVGYIKCVERVAELLELDKKDAPSKPYKVRGKGIAGAYKGPSTPPAAASSAIIYLLEDGTVNLQVSATDIGQGSHTALAQIAAEELGIDVDKIHVSVPNTDYTPYEWQTVGSRTTYSTGNAVIRAARDLKRQLLEYAAEDFNVNIEDLYIEDGFIYSKKDKNLKKDIKDYALGLVYSDGSGRGGPVIGKGIFIPEGVTNLDPETGQGRPVNHWTFGVHGAEVEVDLETGEVDVIKMVSVFDVGRVINPDTCEGQLEGGLIQGMGTALMEEMILKDGKLLNPSFVDYKIPTAMDCPEIITEFVETPLKDGPYGARGIGEPAMIPAAPAIANAVYDAIGVRITSLPITAEKVLKAIKEKRANEEKEKNNK